MRQDLLGSHQKCWVWGRHVVRETLQAGRWIPLEIWLADAIPRDEAHDLTELAARHDIPLVHKSNDELSKRCGSLEHQGLMAKMPPFPYSSLEQVLEHTSPQALLLVLDRLQDPHNFGAMIRSAEVFGADGIVIGTQSQCAVTASVVRSSAGAVNHVPIAQVDDLLETLQALSQHSIRVASAAGDAELTAEEVDLRGSVALVIGNEGVGVDPGLQAESDLRVRIPQFGRVSSLNAAVAAGILLYEARRQRSG